MIYVTICGCFEENAKRHEARADWHIAQGHPYHWAAGSLRKAAKWRAKKAPFALDPKMAPFMEQAYAMMRDAISKQVFGL